MHWDYLKENHSGIFCGMLLDGTLWNHCLEVQRQAEERMDYLVGRMAEAEDGDEIIDLGDEREQVFAELKMFFEPEPGEGAVSLFSIRMYNEERRYKNTSGLDADGLCRAYAECRQPFMEMEKYGELLSEPDYAYMEQSDKVDFSIEFHGEIDRITIFDGKK